MGPEAFCGAGETQIILSHEKTLSCRSGVASLGLHAWLRRWAFFANAFLENRQDLATLVQLVCNQQLRRWPSSWKTIGASSPRTELDPISARKTMRDTKEEQATEDPQRLPSEDT